ICSNAASTSPWRPTRWCRRTRSGSGSRSRQRTATMRSTSCARSWARSTSGSPSSISSTASCSERPAPLGPEAVQDGACAADTACMKSRVWRAYLAGGYDLLALWELVPALKTGPVFNLIALSSPVAIVLAVRRIPRERRPPWYLFALGQTLFVAGDVITYNYPKFFGGAELPFPSIGDVPYLAVYPCLIAGLLIIARRRTPGGDRESLIDSLIVAIGIGALAWVFVMSPTARDTTSTWLQRIVSMAYPFMDLMLLTVVVRLALGAGERPAA